MGFVPYLFYSQFILEGKDYCVYPRPLAMVDPNIGANEREWWAKSNTSSKEVQICASTDNRSTTSKSDTSHSSPRLELVSLNDNISLDSRLTICHRSVKKKTKPTQTLKVALPLIWRIQSTH